MNHILYTQHCHRNIQSLWYLSCEEFCNFNVKLKSSHTFTDTEEVHETGFLIVNRVDKIEGSTATNDTFQIYNDTVGHHQDKGRNGDWRSIKWPSPGFTVYKKLKEKAHSLYDINQETNTNASSTSILHSIQNVKQDREKTLYPRIVFIIMWSFRR